MSNLKPSRGSDQFALRMPDGMRERIKAVADANGRSMNAEIVSTLETVYPPKAIDVRVLSEFLDSLIGASAPDGDPEYLATINDALAKTGSPWTVRSGWDGEVSFLPYATPKDDKQTK